ncbi:hypothetical protein BDY19DRAFT_428472 [Irpex rosettiformis]|uniref:Uncharacterized protein n=1 Tax=Irpex rosettiformis TaxID=378272 RepID=A0ACB8UHE9_9APHY|nr:hypothetical protein BDY19DRAFT_428472 [Irpex rosettiformis]
MKLVHWITAGVCLTSQMTFVHSAPLSERKATARENESMLVARMGRWNGGYDPLPEGFEHFTDRTWGGHRQRSQPIVDSRADELFEAFGGPPGLGGEFGRGSLKFGGSFDH